MQPRDHTSQTKKSASPPLFFRHTLPQRKKGLQTTKELVASFLDVPGMSAANLNSPSIPFANRKKVVGPIQSPIPRQLGTATREREGLYSPPSARGRGGARGELQSVSPPTCGASPLPARGTVFRGALVPERRRHFHSSFARQGPSTNVSGN